MEGNNRFSHNKGLTLVELIVALAILVLVLSIVYPALFLNNKTTASQLKESAQRNEVRAVSSDLTNDIRYSKDVTSSSQTELNIVDKDNATIRYYIDTDAQGNTFLAREKGGVTGFEEIHDASFIIENSKKLVDISLVTDIGNNKHNDFKVNRWLPNLTEDWKVVQSPEFKFVQYVKNDSVFVFGNRMQIDGTSTIAGPDATVIFRQNLTLGGGNVSYITTKRIYVDGSVSLSGSAEIGTDNSEIYVDGGVDVSGAGGGRIYGKLFYTGRLSVKNWITLSAVTQKVSSIQFPEFNIPALKPDAWYAENGYSSNTTARDNMRFFGSSYTFPTWSSYDNVIIASKGNITLSGDTQVTGILFAPNGTVEVSRSSIFTGIIVAKVVSVLGDAHVTFQSVEDYSDLPF